MTLDDDDEDLASGMGAGAAGASHRANPDAGTHDDSAPPSLSHLLIPQNTDAHADQFRVDRPYVSMSEESAMPSAAKMPSDSLMDRLGPVLLIVLPLGGGMAGALNMLQLVPDFSAGSWYAVGTVFVLVLIATLFGGLLATGLFYFIRIRWTMFLRALFVATAVAVSYYGVMQLPRHIQVRMNDLPGLVLR